MVNIESTVKKKISSFKSHLLVLGHRLSHPLNGDDTAYFGGSF